MKVLWLFIFLMADMAAMYSVPHEIRKDHWWRVFPGGGFVLAAEYHYGHRMTVPNLK